MLWALQFSIFLVSSFIEDFLLISFQQKNEIKKGNTLMEFTDLFDVKDFIRNLIDLIRKCVERELYVAVLMVRGISLGKGF